MADVQLAHFCPVFHLECLGVCIIEHHLSGVVVAVAHHIAAESGLALAAVGLYQIEMVFFQRHFLFPYLRVQVVTMGEHGR